MSLHITNPRPHFHVEVNLFHFTLHRISPQVLPIVKRHLSRLVHYTPERSGNKTVMTPTKQYYITDTYLDCYRIPMAFYKDLMTDLINTGLRECDITYHIKPNIGNTPNITDFKHNKYKLREEQVPVVDFMKRQYPAREKNHPFRVDYFHRDYENRVSMLKLTTGGGKTLSSLYTAHVRQASTAIIIKPAYVERWYRDAIFEYFNLTQDDVYIVQGADSLQYLIEQTRYQRRNPYQFIIFTNRTLLMYFSAYQKSPNSAVELYGCAPQDLFSLLDIKLTIYDEIHQDFHFNITSLCYLDADSIIGLSGSLESGDPFIQRLYGKLFTPNSVYENTIKKKYIKVYPMSYGIDNPFRIKTQEYGSSTYSHNAFEKSIRLKPHRLTQYLKIIDDASMLLYFKEYQKGDKYGIYASTIDMCNEIVKHLRSKHKDLKIVKFTAGDSYDDLMNCDIYVSTIGKSGTALDIPNLRALLLTIAIDSVQANIQLPGRLRELPDRDVKFGWIYCESITKHLVYSNNRKRIIANKAAFIKDLHTYITIKA